MSLLGQAANDGGSRAGFKSVVLMNAECWAVINSFLRGSRNTSLRALVYSPFQYCVNLPEGELGSG